MWFIIRLAWIQNTLDKNKCFWACLVGTFIIQALLVVMVEVSEKPKTTVLTEVVKNSEALQELPEKSFEALNRFLDSIVPEEEQKE